RDFSDMSGLPRKIAPIALLDRGVMRAGMEIYQGGKLVGWVTSGTMVPYFKTEGEGLSTVILEASGKRAIGLCYIDNDILVDDTVEVDVRGKRLKAVIPCPPHERGRSSLRPPRCCTVSRRRSAPWPAATAPARPWPCCTRPSRTTSGVRSSA
ncbi:glycine cleavage system aminomethyltransferase T, partial [human gut metagenome]